MNRLLRWFGTPAVIRISAGLSLLLIPFVFAVCGKDVTGPGTQFPLELGVSVTVVVDSVRVGSRVTRTASLTVTGTGEQTIRWTATIANQSAWLSLSASNGGVPRTITATLNPQDLPVGLHQDTIIFKPDGSSNRLRVPVQLHVNSCELATIVLGSEASGSLGVEDCEAPNRPDHLAKLHSFSATGGDSVTIVLHSDDFQGYLVIDSTTVGSAPPLAEDGRCRDFAGDPCLYNVHLPKTGTYVVEVTTASVSDTGAYSLTMFGPRVPGAPAGLGQFNNDSVSTLAVGAELGTATLVLQARVTDPDSLDDIRLQVELQPVGTAFTGTATDSSGVFSPGDTAVVAASVNDDTDYHWQARTVDGTGRASTWVAFGGNSEGDPDFGVGIADVPTAPDSLVQFLTDSATTVGTGENIPEPALVLSGEVSDPDPGEVLRLEVEVQPVGTAFTGAVTATSESVSNGSAAVVVITGLSEDTEYHWRGRAVDVAGSASGWTSYGGNDEDDADFGVSIPATHLAFEVHPSDAVAATAIAPAIQVWAREASGVTDTMFTGSITLAITEGTGATGATLLGTTTVNAVKGVATFDDLNIELAFDYTLDASSAGLDSATSDAFAIIAGTTTQIGFSVQPSDVAIGFAISPVVVIAAQDVFGNDATDLTGDVTMVMGINPGGGTLSGTLIVTAVNGLATFDDLSIDALGDGYTLDATAASFMTTSDPFDVVIGPASQLVFTEQPTDAEAGDDIAPAIQVTAQDNFGNTADFTDDVTLAISNNPSGGTLLGTVTVAAVGGVATFNDVGIDLVGEGYTLSASATDLASDISDPIDISNAPASQLTFSVQPSTTAGGEVITPAVEVTALDAFGNVALDFTNQITVSIEANPSGGTLSGDRFLDAFAGVAVFSELNIDAVGIGYTLEATAGAVSAESDPFDIVVGEASRIAFTVQPTNVTAGVAISPAVEVSVQDDGGNVVTDYTGNVVIAIENNPTGGTLSGATNVAVVNGVATFSNLSIDLSGGGYTLSATLDSFTATSDAFDNLAGSATQLVFTGQPTDATAGDDFVPAIQVTAQDDLGNTADFTSDVTLAISNNPGGTTLMGTVTVAAVGGVATFSDVNIEVVGNGYTLSASATGLPSGTSDPFDISNSPASQMEFTVQPSNTGGGEIITPAVVITVLDAFGNVAVDFTGTVNAAIGTNAGGGTLSGTVGVDAVSGVATFSDLSIDAVGTGYTLEMTSGTVSATSNLFDIVVGTASQLEFTVQPTDEDAGTAISPALEVSVLDNGGNLVTDFTGNITMAIGNNPSGGTLSGTLTQPVVTGVATFSDLSIDIPGVDYTLSAISGALSAESGEFDIDVGAATQLVFTVQPTDAAAGADIAPDIQVTAQDDLGNTTDFTGDVTLAISNNPGGTTLMGDVTVAAVGGVATFSDVNIEVVGNGYTLSASATGLPSTTSDPFDISNAAAAQMEFTVQPSNTGGGEIITPAVVITVLDDFGNVAVDFTGTVNAAIGTNAGGGTLSGTLNVDAVSGVVTFSDLSIDAVGTGYTLEMTSGTVSATSDPFDIDVGAAAQLVFTVQPTDASMETVIIPAVQVTVQDLGGNVVTDFVGDVDMDIGNNPSGGTLSGTLTQAVASGVATFDDLSIDADGIDYTLSATSGALSAESDEFDIVVGAATQLSFTVQPSGGTAGESTSLTMEVTAQNNLGATVTEFTGDITVEIGNNPGGGALSGTVTVTAVNGVATFSDLNIVLVGSGYTLEATAGPLDASPSSPFDIEPADALSLGFTVHPVDTNAGELMVDIVVTAYDPFGNVATNNSGGFIDLAIDNNPSGGTLSGPTSVTLDAGVVVFRNVSIDIAGTGYTLIATCELDPAVSNAFDILEP